ncbi:MAG: sulfatase, partial [Verrucomicrobiota bacterium]
MRFLALLVLAGLAAGLNGRGAPGRPNLLLVIADDASAAHFGANGDPAVRTPHFDRVAREGANFRQVFCSSPSCTPSRAALLTGQDFFRLGSTANLWSAWPAGLEGYPDRLAAAGYRVGLQGKGWGPGDFRAGGRTNNPAGPAAGDFRAFLRTLPAGTPFAFWHGSQDPHRPYEAGSGAKAGVDPARVQVPGYLPDLPEVRSDLADYLAEIERFDRQLGELLTALEEAGQLDQTLVIVTSDNGLPFPRGKATAYDAGTRMPLAMRWPGRIAAGRTVDALVSHTDLAPTILEAAGLAVPDSMTGRSLLSHLGSSGKPPADWRDAVVVGRERHAAVRAGNLGYPIRGLRTGRHLYLRNEAPGRWPAGDPPRWGDVDPADGLTGSPTKAAVVGLTNDPARRHWFDLAFARRPAEELYDLAQDPWQTNNLAAQPGFSTVRDKLRRRLSQELRQRGDPRAQGRGREFEQEVYVTSGPAGAPGPVSEVLGIPQIDLAGDHGRQTTV